VRAAIFATDNVIMRNPALRALPGADQTRVTAEAVLGYLIGHGLITVHPVQQWPEWLGMEIPDHLRPDVDGLIARWASLRRAL
jgi:hypothetical protein